ncbi:MAG TPA: DnaJ C-terminal domain-containing protein [Ktedonobacterales bacterium]|jgi:curved DNA-binding protein CbpA
MADAALRIFISYSRTDSTFVDRLESDLNANRFHAWVDRRKLEGGQDWMDELEKAIDACHVVLIVVSPDAVKSEYVRMEYRHGRAQGKSLIPVHLRTTQKIPMDLSTLQWVNFQEAYEEGLRDLLIALNRLSIPVVSATLPLSDDQAYGSAQPQTPTSDPQKGSTASTANTSKHGEDIHQPVELSLGEAYNGTKRTFLIQSPLYCPSCSGTGEILGKACTMCNGEGQTTRRKRIEVAIPAGVVTGSKVRVAGEGQLGLAGAPRGDLFLVITVLPNPNYKRESNDLFTDLPVELGTLKQGGEVIVALPDGKRVLLTIPPKTQNGQEFRLTGKGMSNIKDGTRGNLYIKVHVILKFD